MTARLPSSDRWHRLSLMNPSRFKSWRRTTCLPWRKKRWGSLTKATPGLSGTSWCHLLCRHSTTALSALTSCSTSPLTNSVTSSTLPATPTTGPTNSCLTHKHSAEVASTTGMLLIQSQLGWSSKLASLKKSTSNTMRQRKSKRSETLNLSKSWAKVPLQKWFR